MTGQYGRRRFLAGASLTGAGLLAGCLNDSNSGEPEASETATTTEELPDVVTEIGFEGMDLVVGLRPDAAVSKLNLISPDGTAFASKSVTRGATTVRIPILELRQLSSRYRHYSPGIHELVVITEDSVKRTQLSLEPDVQLVDIEVNSVARDGLRQGKLLFRMENQGTAPTWIFDITYEGAPNFGANDPLSDFPGLPKLQSPSEAPDLVLGPNEQVELVPESNPLRFSSREYSGCDLGIFEIRALIGVATGEMIQVDLAGQIDGDEINQDLLGEYACSESSVEISAIKRSRWEN
ncbi:hypothetical protein [Haloarchaeobius sp. HME9146]|uniref:hypothetical protein n=1 Tax=Haloarchaeobius sp. HME9146 TaxID=2978732 RepID=UPI0021C23230|nr:hypothetical protein [Haloarchaeobius sp. HME9146]MCT9098159.1 hypothetical protein [Haloarchaeobius sp. HME9146]